MNRREFLFATAAAATALPALSFSGKLFAAPASTPRFLLVFLRGGYDCNNLLIPYNSDAALPGASTSLPHDAPALRDSGLYRDAISQGLSVATSNALTQAKSPAEWNTFLLSSPDFNYR